MFDPNLDIASRYRCPGQNRAPFDASYYKPKTIAFPLGFIPNEIIKGNKPYCLDKEIEAQNSFKRLCLNQNVIGNLIGKTNYRKRSEIIQEIIEAIAKRWKCTEIKVGLTLVDVSQFKSSWKDNCIEYQQSTTSAKVGCRSINLFYIIDRTTNNQPSLMCANIPVMEKRDAKIGCRSILLGPVVLQILFGTTDGLSEARACRLYPSKSIQDLATYSCRSRTYIDSANLKHNAERRGCVASEQPITVRRGRCGKAAPSSSEVPTLVFGRMNAGLFKPKFTGQIGFTGRVVG